MRVNVTLHAILSEYKPQTTDGTSFMIEIEPKSTIAELLKVLHIPEDSATIFLVKGKLKKQTEVLEEGDIIDLFPPIAGG